VLDLRNGSLRDAAERPINRWDAAGPARSVVNQPLIDRGWASGRCPVVRGGRVFHATIGSVTRRDKKGVLATRHSGKTCQLTALAIVRPGATPDAFRKSSCGLPCLILEKVAPRCSGATDKMLGCCGSGPISVVNHPVIDLWTGIGPVSGGAGRPCIFTPPLGR